MIQILKIIIMKIFSILPDSPFSDFFTEMDTGFLTYLNFFLPVDICSNIMLTWLACVLGVFLYFFARNILNNVTHTIMKGISGVVAGGGIPAA